jgi:DNA-binding response OmpR family regulator
MQREVAPPADRLSALLVEDDAHLARTLSLSLADEGLEMRHEATGAAAREALRRQVPDVVLLDLGLPDEDGLQLCADIRTYGDVPIIVVTARDDSRDVVAGLEAGADDYISKPVVGSELAARIRALLRRTAPDDPDRWVSCADLQVSTRHGLVRRGEEEISMTRTERRLLCELALHCGQVVTREALLERVWGYDYFGDSRLLDVHIRRLRLKVEPDPAVPRHIVTIRGLGYRLEP